MRRILCNLLCVAKWLIIILSLAIFILPISMTTFSNFLIMSTSYGQDIANTIKSDNSSYKTHVDIPDKVQLFQLYDIIEGDCVYLNELFFLDYGYQIPENAEIIKRTDDKDSEIIAYYYESKKTNFYQTNEYISGFALAVYNKSDIEFPEEWLTDINVYYGVKYGSMYDDANLINYHGKIVMIRFNFDEDKKDFEQQIESQKEALTKSIIENLFIYRR